MRNGLAWVPPQRETLSEEVQVLEVQRMEGIRLALEVLTWGMDDREGAVFFAVSSSNRQNCRFS